MTPDPALRDYLAAREALIANAVDGASAARELADLTDGAVLGLTGPASPVSSARFALFALGGYGARRLLPHSDVDLLLVVPDRSPDAESVVRAVVYPLWDAGLAVGHQVRTPTDHARALTEDVQILTSFLTARFIAGDRRLAADVLERSSRRLGADAHRARTEILSRERPGSPYLLEPDLKEGAGAQRDIDELVWHAALTERKPGAALDTLVELGALDPGELPLLEQAGDAITAARWWLHKQHGRAQNVLRVDDLGTPFDAESLQRGLENTHHLLLEARERLTGAGTEPVAPVDLSYFVRAAERGPSALPSLERAAWKGWLDPVVPGFAASMTARRPALSHRLTVGAHALRTLTGLAESGEGDPLPQTDPFRSSLAIAALTHDIGKLERSPGHAERGAAMAAQAALRLGLPQATAAEAALLVREHLLLADTAAHRDLADEDVVLAAAGRIADRRLVGPLYLLARADMRATGPGVWTPWRRALIGDLAAKLEAALSPDVDGAGIAAAAEVTRSIARKDALSVGSSRAVLDFLDRAPLRYLARREPAEVLHDAQLVRTLSGPARFTDLSYSVRPGPATGTWVLDVVVRDRQGLFALLAGVLALTGLDVLAAEAYTEQRGVAIDTFTVTGATLAPVGPETWNSFEQSVRAALAGRLSLEERLAERRRHYPSASGGATAETRIAVGARGVFTTPVVVTAADRVGLLHDLAHAIDAAGYDIRRAMITTVHGVARDTFELTDAEGAPPEPDVLSASLGEALEQAAGA